jgi:hypothetical protein
MGVRKKISTILQLVSSFWVIWNTQLFKIWKYSQEHDFFTSKLTEQGFSWKVYANHCSAVKKWRMLQDLKVHYIFTKVDHWTLHEPVEPLNEVFLIRLCMNFSSAHVFCMSFQSHITWTNHHSNTRCRVQIINSSLWIFSNLLFLPPS